MTFLDSEAVDDDSQKAPQSIPLTPTDDFIIDECAYATKCVAGPKILKKLVRILMILCVIIILLVICRSPKKFEIVSAPGLPGGGGEENVENVPRVESAEDLLAQGKLYMKSDVRKSLDYYIKSAEKGSAEGAFQAGCLYINNDTIEKDLHKALFFLDLAAVKGGHAEAALTLFQLLNSGEYGFTKNTDEAFRYLHIAAQTEALAQFFIAEIYMLGKGSVEKNLILAEQYALKSYRQQKDPIYRVLLSKIYYAGTSPEQHQKAVSLIREDAEAGVLQAQIIMADSYMDLKGHPTDIPSETRYQEIEKWLNRAGANGHAQSLHNLGIHYERRALQHIGKKKADFQQKAKRAYKEAEVVQSRNT